MILGRRVMGGNLTINFTALRFCDPVSAYICTNVVNMPSDCLQGYTSILPDRTVPAVGVPSCHCAHLCASGGILVDVHDVMIDGEHRAFIHIPHCDFKRGGVFERTQIGKTRVCVRVHALDVEGVGLLSLIVKRLLGT